MDPNLLNSPSKDVVLALGTMWGSLDGGTTYDVPFGALQDFTLDTKHTLKELRDPLFRTAGATGSVASEVTLKAKVAQIRGRALQTLLGGVLSYDGTTRSHISIDATNIRPTPFAVQVHSRNDPTAEVIGTIYKCIGEQLSLAIKPEDYIMKDESFKCYGDPANGNKILDISLVGDHTSDGAASPAAPASPSATAGAASSGLIILGWTLVASATAYNIYRGTATGGPYIWVGSTASVEFVDKGTSSTHYYYVITAETGAGESVHSTQVDAVAP